MGVSETPIPRLQINYQNESQLAELQQISQQLRSLQQDAVQFPPQDSSHSETFSSSCKQDTAR